jgi:hypothetical protein
MVTIRDMNTQARLADHLNRKMAGGHGGSMADAGSMGGGPPGLCGP